MKKYILLLIILGITFSNTFAQDAGKEKSQPVSLPFDSGYLIDQPTTFIPDAKTLEFSIQHKFGSVQNGKSDLWGIYSPGANVRLGLDYVPIKNVQVGAGITKKNMYTDLNAKWTIFQQTEDNSMPVAIGLFGSLAIDGRNTSAFETDKAYHPGEGLSEYSMVFGDRLAYFSQLIIGRKFCDWFSLQAAASFTHYNMVGKTYDHDIVGAHVNGRIKFSPQSSIIFNYDVPLKIKDISEQTSWDTHAEPIFAVGVDISTFTHSFQIYVGNANGILPQENMMFNQNKFNKEGIAIGFTITRLWMF
ncbi:MAG TPA: DUF5777 family beta-barrel protein [Draconibacterium sp.]|nr:DUF5777 family beta-barrel protein [Draconibacterium sp.]